jgi:putative transposase
MADAAAMSLDEWVVMPNHHSLISPRRDTLPVIVRTYKAAVTTFCRRAGYAGSQWQRSYYERVIRDDAELSRVRQYISDNPTHWNQDEHHAR